MEIPASGMPENRTAFALGVDCSNIIRRVVSPKEARSLPRGVVVGDQHGGLTFTDAVAAALESRSHAGWQELQTASGDTWTVIVVDR